MSLNQSDLELIAKKLKEDIAFYKNTHIFLTGGTGFFGKWLLEAFIFLNKKYSTNIKVTILSRSPSNFINQFPHLGMYEFFTYVQGDVRNFVLENEIFDLIIHAATDASVELNLNQPDLMRSTIMEGAKNICDFAAKSSCKRILFTSSGAVYGTQPVNMKLVPETFNNNLLFDSKNAYSSAKLESEIFFKENANCEVVIARCFAFAGPYLPLIGGYAFGNFINDIINEKDIVIKGNGKDIRSYLYAADLVIWLLRILSSGKHKEIYNVGSSKCVSIAELACLIQSISGAKSNIKILSKSSKNINRYVPDITKSKIQLNLDIYTSLEEAIKRTLQFNNIKPI